MIAIQTRSLSKKYGDRTAVDSLDLSIRQGVFGLLGVNGAGKTTTIRMLACLTQPTSGDATVLGRSILTEPRAVKALINLSPQETAVAPNLTVSENLALIAGIYESDRRTARRQVEEVIRKLGLSDVRSERAKILSGGWQRRFLDEPTLGLDVFARRELWSVIRDLKGGITIILTTHYMEEAQALADEIGIMAEGRLKAQGTADELVSLTGAGDFEEAFLALAKRTEVLP